MNNFFAVLYEAVLYLQGFSNDLYQANAYMLIGLLMIFSSLLLEIIYYYFISNYSSFYKRRFWVIWILIICIINFAIAYYNSTVTMEDFYALTDGGNPYAFKDYFSFSMVNVLWALIFSFLFSLILKFKSIKASKTPF